MLRFTTLLLTALLALAVTGCVDQDAQEGPAAEKAAEAKPVQTMQPGQKRAEIDQTFPVEVPVAEGQIVRGRSQGADAWDYEVLVDSPVGSVADWYRQAYLSRGWVVSEERPVEGGAIELTFMKGEAQSRVAVSPEGETARAIVILGVGAPVLQTQ